MKRAQRPKDDRPSAGPHRRGRRRADPDGLRALKALSKNELVALVLKLQAQNAAEAVAPAVPAAAGPAGEEPAAPDGRPGETSAARKALVIDSSVRSGQTVAFPEGDITVIGSVGSGAEIIAGGSIHVYGSLRGRAVAGTSGDQTARIFCQEFDAELLSIDGKYRVADNVDRELRGRPVQARLDGLRMMLVPLETAAAPAAPAMVRQPASADRLRRAKDRVRQFITVAAPRGGSVPEGSSP